jgi:diaminohydroxyphosphoribosylaminopyrimidine deaminase/5-amino-6-(5-phosphoribosylamino)uracil reductase
MNPRRLRDAFMTAADEYWMRQALALAERGRGHVEPNPLVGAVVVRDGRAVGEGWHRRFGEAHAEVNALAAAGEAAQGAALYVTLEPCCHYGKTPPCTDAVLRAGIRRVFAAMEDPFPAVSGKGLALLRTGRVETNVGLCQQLARRLNAPYLKLLATGRPWVHAKWAMTLDGKIATRSGDSKWISNEASRRYVHELRGRVDAIVVGIGTALADDPQLTARPPGPRTAARIILDSRGRLPITGRLVLTARQVPVIVATAAATAEHCDQLRSCGCEVVPLAGHDGRVDVQGLLAELGRRRFTNVLVEGGSGVLGSFFDAGQLDEAHVVIAPRLAGGAAALTPVGGHGVDRIATALRLAECAVQDVAGDIFVHGYLARDLPA